MLCILPITILVACATASRFDITEEEKGFLYDWAFEPPKINERIIILEEILKDVTHARESSLERIRAELPLSVYGPEKVNSYFSKVTSIVGVPEWFHEHLMSRWGSFDEEHITELVEELMELKNAYPNDPSINYLSMRPRIRVWTKYCVLPLLQAQEASTAPCNLVTRTDGRYWVLSVEASRQFVKDVIERESLALN